MPQGRVNRHYTCNTMLTMPTVRSKPNPTEQDRRGVATLALMSAIWGSSFLLVTLSLRLFEPAEVVSGRLLIGGGFLAIVVLLTRQSFHGLLAHWHWLLLVSVFNYAIPFFLMAWAQQTVSSSTTAIFMSGIPLYTLLLTRIMLDQQVSARRWFGFLIGCVGLIGLAMANGANPSLTAGSNLPYGALILAGTMLAGGSIIIRRMPSMPSLPATSVLLIIGGLLLLPFGGINIWQTGVETISKDVMTPAFGALMALVFLAVVPTGLGQFMRTFTIQIFGPVFYSLVGYLIPIVATVLGVFILDEVVSPQIIGAFALILVGLLLAHDGGFAIQPKSPRV